MTGTSHRYESKGRAYASTELSDSGQSVGLTSDSEGALEPPTLVQCKHCGRSFALHRISYHESVCTKQAEKCGWDKGGIRSKKRGGKQVRSNNRSGSESPSRRRSTIVHASLAGALPTQPHTHSAHPHPHPHVSASSSSHPYNSHPSQGHSGQHPNSQLRSSHSINMQYQTSFNHPNPTKMAPARGAHRQHQGMSTNQSHQSFSVVSSVGSHPYHSGGFGGGSGGTGGYNVQSSTNHYPYNIAPHHHSHVGVGNTASSSSYVHGNAFGQNQHQPRSNAMHQPQAINVNEPMSVDDGMMEYSSLSPQNRTGIAAVLDQNGSGIVEPTVEKRRRKSRIRLQVLNRRRRTQVQIQPPEDDLKKMGTTASSSLTESQLKRYHQNEFFENRRQAQSNRERMLADLSDYTDGTDTNVRYDTDSGVTTTEEVRYYDGSFDGDGEDHSQHHGQSSSSSSVNLRAHAQHSVSTQKVTRRRQNHLSKKFATSETEEEQNQNHASPTLGSPPRKKTWKKKHPTPKRSPNKRQNEANRLSDEGHTQQRQQHSRHSQHRNSHPGFDAHQEYEVQDSSAHPHSDGEIKTRQCFGERTKDEEDKFSATLNQALYDVQSSPNTPPPSSSVHRIVSIPPPSPSPTPRTCQTPSSNPQKYKPPNSEADCYFTNTVEMKRGGNGQVYTVEYPNDNNSRPVQDDGNNQPVDHVNRIANTEQIADANNTQHDNLSTLNPQLSPRAKEKVVVPDLEDALQPNYATDETMHERREDVEMEEEANQEVIDYQERKYNNEDQLEDVGESIGNDWQPDTASGASNQAARESNLVFATKPTSGAHVSASVHLPAIPRPAAEKSRKLCSQSLDTGLPIIQTKQMPRRGTPTSTSHGKSVPRYSQTHTSRSSFLQRPTAQEWQRKT